MTACVVDASVVVKWFFQEEHTDRARWLLERKYEIRVPHFLYVEFDNYLCQRVRRRDMPATEVYEVRDALRQFPITVESTAPLLDAAFELALRTGCTVYDALYVALADARQIRLITADARLALALAHDPLSGTVVLIENLV